MFHTWGSDGRCNLKRGDEEICRSVEWAVARRCNGAKELVALAPEPYGGSGARGQDSPGDPLIPTSFDCQVVMCICIHLSDVV